MKGIVTKEVKPVDNQPAKKQILPILSEHVVVSATTSLITYLEYILNSHNT